MSHPILSMTFLINCSNLKSGGGLQVADSVCGQLGRYPQHRFVVVLSKYLRATGDRIKDYNNVTIFEYDVKNNFKTVLLGRDDFLDGLVRNLAVQAVLTIFGPSRWNPHCKHLSGFAMPHMVIPESPFFTEQPFFKRWRWRIRSKILTYFFWRSTDNFWTENPYISARLEKLMGGVNLELKNESLDTKEQRRALVVIAFVERRAAA